MTNALPFTISKTENFFDRLGEYIGDVFYDILPEQGYELRDEQIFMAYQLEKAFKDKTTIFAEAGVGTGKTFVYLLYAICYARYKRKPAIISCADETLIEQLVKKNGDIEKLEKALGLTIDVRLAKAREQYVCLKKLDPLANKTDDEDIIRVHDQIPDFVFDQGTSMQSFERYGDRKEYPWLSDEKWGKIGWDPIQQCSTCEWRHRSSQTLNRDYYRHATDLIICSHDFYMEHVWTKESRKREGQMPLLPEPSCVVFDEGHLLEFAAQKGLTYRFNALALHTILTGYMSQDVREESLYLIEDILTVNENWFTHLSKAAKSVKGSNRKEIAYQDLAIDQVKQLERLVHELLEQLVFDSELFTIDAYHIKIIEEYLEFYSYGLSILLKSDQGIFWLEEDKEQTSLVIMPRLVEQILKEEVFNQPIPFIFSSATLSQDKDFTYIATSLGIEQYESFTVSSPFDYEENMTVVGHIEMNQAVKFMEIKEEIKNNKGRSLVLFASKEDMNQFRVWASKQDWEIELIYEGDREISESISYFQANQETTLCSYNLWEGLDVPGDALTQVLITSPPFPPNDPVFKAKRSHVNNAEEEVDIPYMLLRLRQGIGRLIRTASDSGSIHLWMNNEQKNCYLEAITNVLPVKLSFE
ncbi:ATP-dependent DNA helicase [Aquibacillus salsiterrae]|uniref:ATP-dependent DNA helicase n=1 Tax=Aquibacillus salsiterrae TaxID=2950439 RepID=A0A9X3WJ15_9BACI|nr:ATP-dependent DNA helicase [Aquibacillus salsiterrae]MDC3417961.1 ATP-dependent DNA helicase [Aquibacillus salsiterrae]